MSADQQPTTAGVITRRDLAGTELERRAETAATAAAAQVRAQMEFHYLMALRQPRDWEEVRLAILRECNRPVFAREALYNKPIGKGVIGLSIRFAEKALTCMRNVGSDTIVMFDDDRKRIVRQVVTDYESNVTFSKDVTIEKTVERRQVREGQEVLARRMNSTGQLVYLVRATEDDLLNKEGALISKAMRTNVLRILPGDIQAEAEERIRQVLSDQHAQDPEGRKKAMLSKFYELGVKPAQIAEYLGHAIDEPITAEEFSTLLGLHNAIRDGEASMRDAIELAKAQRGETSAVKSDEPQPATATARVADKLKKQRPASKPDAKPETSTSNEVEKEEESSENPAVERLSFALLELANGNKAEADILLSQATAGKLQKLDVLAAAIAESPGWVELIDAFIIRRTEGGGE